MQISASLPDTQAATAKEAGGPGFAPHFAIVVAVFNEAENVGPVTAEILDAARKLGEFELIYVDDGSDDGTAPLMDMLLSKKRAADRKEWLETKGDLASLEV